MSSKTKGSPGSAASKKNKHELALMDPTADGSQEVESQKIVETDSKHQFEEEDTAGKMRFHGEFS